MPAKRASAARSLLRAGRGAGGRGGRKAAKTTKKRQPSVTGELLVMWEFCRGSHFLGLYNSVQITPSYTMAQPLSSALRWGSPHEGLNRILILQIDVEKGHGGEDRMRDPYSFHSSQQSTSLHQRHKPTQGSWLGAIPSAILRSQSQKLPQRGITCTKVWEKQTLLQRQTAYAPKSVYGG